ncbi:PepSY domain-containing protein [Dyadobacter sp. CY261]|uniref:PepSY-associated TM helix domain-containing protein n=1 Tax=Dyadobacter sp. CY261 TaxID=2907203 RepID=UPI001F2A63B8|nr:PepSY-associated TM helix domain-containing protein [Dyadobacter sp. CY261]MCF0074948.1 PepSY domain-containing protein [Dyadobacter sp. CY261]
MTLKKIASVLHLWLGLAVGIVVVCSFLPAALFVWEKELTDLYYHDYIFVEPNGKPPQSLTKLLEVASKSVPADQALEEVNISGDPKRAYIFSGLEHAKDEGWNAFSEVEYSTIVYVDPYTAKVLGVVDQETDWIWLLRIMHQQLLLQYDIGHMIVGISTLIMIVMVITGLILWWPRNKGALKQRFKMKFNAKWRRVNYDIHNVGGFYTQLFILIFAATGLVWTFEWWTDGIYRLLGDNPEKVFNQVPVLRPNGQIAANPLDRALSDMITKKAEWDKISFFLSEKKFLGVIRYDGDSGWDTWDLHHYDARNGDLYFSVRHEDKTTGAKFRNSNYAIHVGSIYGIFTKIIATFIALFCSSLPVTGFYIWWGRNRKEKKSGSHRKMKTTQSI